jgi:hypothetical protein
MDENWLREKAREVIRAGRLPDRSPDRTWGGPGCGGNCTVCGNPLICDESELELEFFGCREHPCRIIHHLHLQCFDAWELERLNALANKRRDSPNGHSLSAEKDARTIDDRERNHTQRRGQT